MTTLKHHSMLSLIFPCLCIHSITATNPHLYKNISMQFLCFSKNGRKKSGFSTTNLTNYCHEWTGWNTDWNTTRQRLHKLNAVIINENGIRYFRERWFVIVFAVKHEMAGFILCMKRDTGMLSSHGPWFFITEIMGEGGKKRIRFFKKIVGYTPKKKKQTKIW